MAKSCTGLNEKGQAEFESFIDEHARDDVSRDYFVWWSSLNFDNASLEHGFHFELGSYYAKSKNPVILTIDVDSLEIEEIDD